ncbi:MAG TPA: hypothetical protein VM764_04330 [Gemmatimonadaceae bacterium]|jgi:hypothetical protein|nr:hypothetical protein [Gemmatimonadaceae bacterium]
MAIEFAQASQVNAAYASTPGTAPTTDWQQILVNPSGTQNFHSEQVEVVANPQDPSMVKQLGEQVGENAAPTLVVDWSKDVAYLFGRGFLRSAPKYPWSQAPLRPTAFTTSAITVSGAETLPAGTIIKVTGAANAGNNGVFTLESGSNATTLNVPASSFTAETVSPAGSVLVEVVGFEFSSGDLNINSDGDLTTSSQDVTVFDLVPGHRVYFRASDDTGSFPDASLTEGLHYATIEAAPTTNLLQLKHRTFSAAAVSGTGRTVRLYFGACFRNVPFGHADYIREPAWWLELVDPSVGAADADVYSYATSSVLNSLSLSLGVETKIEATLSFMARKIDGYNESADRLAGASSAYRPLQTALYHTMCASMLAFRVVKVSDETEVIGEVNTATFAINHNVMMRKAIGGCGAEGAIFGDIDPGLTGMSIFFEDADQARAISDRTIVRAEMLMKNAQGAIAIDMPTGRLTGGAKTYPENGAVMLDANFVPHGDPLNSNVVCAINVLGHIPTADPSATET